MSDSFVVPFEGSGVSRLVLEMGVFGPRHLVLLDYKGGLTCFNVGETVLGLNMVLLFHGGVLGREHCYWCVHDFGSLYSTSSSFWMKSFLLGFTGGGLPVGRLECERSLWRAADSLVACGLADGFVLCLPSRDWGFVNG